jgi:hypothetical protein
MADLAAGDLTYTLVKQRKEDSSNKVYNFTVAFGNGALTYPSGGVPLTAGNLGCPNQIISLVIDGPASADGLIYKYDKANNKIRMYRAPAQTHAHDLKIIGGQAATTTNEVGHYATDILGKEAATDATVAKADSATKGGVLSETLAAAALVEVTAASYAPAATTLYVEVTGW